MKTQVPESLKSDLPSTTWGKILTATPVGMAVIATMLAGLASSEMTEAGYTRSLAAQQQAKAGDQWSFFQAKRLRSAVQHSTLDVLENTAEVHPLDLDSWGEGTWRSNPAVKAALQKGEVPIVDRGRPMDQQVERALSAVTALATETELSAAVAGVDAGLVDQAVADARARATALEAVTQPVNEALDAMERSLATAPPGRRRDFTAARLRYTARRYDAEAHLNQSVASLVELQVHKSNQLAERHRRRSQRFFLGMLAAQAAVIISTFSLAARKHSLLWSVAAVAGLTATGFAVWVYFYV